MHIVLVEPEIPGNTGNIARLCAATGCQLHLVKPLGFSTDDKYLKRAGLDYWSLVEVFYHENFAEVAARLRGHNFFYCTTKGAKPYSAVSYDAESVLVFGKETAGLPEELLRENLGRAIRIPMVPGARSLNLANSVAVIVYEALRQLSFPALAEAGSLGTSQL